MLELMIKYGIPSGGDAGQSRTSSVILGLSPQKKRIDKAEGKDKSVISGAGTKSVASSKYSVGSKLKSCAIIKKVKEEDWELTKTDAKYKFFKCKLCKKDVRGDNRKTHTCK